jgi:guanylate kinase
MTAPSNISPSGTPPSDTLHRRGLMFILSSPSGAGKTTIARRILAEDGHIRLSVSYTTRPIRPGEVHGRDYFFVGADEFARKVEDGEFIEWAEVFGHLYGTPKAEIKAGLKAGQDYLFDIDWQGTQQLYQRMEVDVVRVFLLPPSIGELERRLSSRGTDSADVVADRMARARSEISHWDGYDYVVINDDIDACFDKVTGILHSERMRRARQTGLVDFVRELMA